MKNYTKFLLRILLLVTIIFIFPSVKTSAAANINASLEGVSFTDLSVGPQLNHSLQGTGGQRAYNLKINNVESSTPSHYYIKLKTYNSDVTITQYTKMSNTGYWQNSSHIQSYNTTVLHEFNYMPYSDYCVVVSGPANASYSITLTEDKDDYPDTKDYAKAQSIGRTVPGRLSSCVDHDYFSLTTGSSNCYYNIDLTNKDVSWGNLNMDNIILGAKSCVGISISDASTGDRVYTSYLAAKTRTTAKLKNIVLEPKHKYHVVVYGTGIGSYSFKFTKGNLIKAVPTDKDKNRTPEEAVTIKLNKAATFTLDNSADVDYYKFKTSAFSEYKMRLRNISCKNSSVSFNLYTDESCEDIYLNQPFWAPTGGYANHNIYRILKPNTTYYLKVFNGSKGKYSVGVEVFGSETMSVTSTSKKKATIRFDKVSGATHYQIYRSTSKNGKYKKVKTLSASTRKWTDTKLKSRKKYYYKVRAYNKTKKVYSIFTSAKGVTVK